MQKYSKMMQIYHSRDFESVPLSTKCEITEKLHGTNFSFLVRGEEVIHCSRNNELEEDTKFFNHLELTKYDNNALDMKLNYFPEADEVQIFGEYVGQGIQKGIDYGQRDFYCFDIRVDGSYINQGKVVGLCALCNFNHVPVLSYCTLEEALTYPNEFQSTLLKTNEDNICEGIVIKPFEPMYIKDARVVIKSKNEKWTEKASKRKVSKQSLRLTDAEQEVFEVLVQYATEARVRCVASKEQDWTFGKLLGMTAKDAIEDAVKENPELDFTPVTKFFNKHLTNVVRPVFLETL